MKFSGLGSLLIAFGALQATAAPAKTSNLPRQNDMPKCEDGERGPSLFSMYDNAHCDNQCTYQEGADGDTKGDACTGECKMNIPMAVPGGGSMPPRWYCSGTWED